MRTTAPDARREAASPPADRGMSLVEVMVAVALFAVLSSAVLVVLTSTVKVSNDDGLRTVASNLAARELEITREIYTSQSRGPDKVPIGERSNQNPLPDGTIGDDLEVDGIPFKVVRIVHRQVLDQDYASSCDQDSGTFAYASVEVRVTWPGVDDDRALVMNTIMTPPKGTYRPDAGHIGVKVIDALGKPRAGVAVTATPKPGTPGLADTETTGDDGCALIADLVPGSYDVKASAPGFVSQQGEPTPTLTAEVQTASLWKGSFFLDRAAALDVTICPPNGYSLPSSLSTAPMTLGHPSLLPAGAKSFTGTGSRSVKNCAVSTTDADGEIVTPPADLRLAESRSVPSLWPYPSGYQAWVGRCLDNDPQHYPAEAVGRDAPVTVEPGETAATTLTLQPVEVSVSGGSATSVIAIQMTVNASGVLVPTDSSCASGQTILLGSSVPGGKLKVSLPYGIWRIQRASGSGTKTDITVVKNGPVVSASI